MYGERCPNLTIKDHHGYYPFPGEHPYGVLDFGSFHPYFKTLFEHTFGMAFSSRGFINLNSDQKAPIRKPLL